MRIGDVCVFKTNFEDADFWLQRKGSIDTVGKPTKVYYKENIGVKIREEYQDKLDTNYLYYYFLYLYQKGAFKPLSHGTLNLQNITISDIKSIPIEFG
jgi:hypothetical protein